jgi:hypothetical protein
MRHRATLASVFAVFLALTASAGAEEIVTKRSGAIVSIADDARTFVLAEVGPWQMRKNATVITHRTITLMPDTQFAMVGRADDAPSGFPGDFVEVALGPEAVYLNDFVTVECREKGKQLLARKITVTELVAEADSGEQTLR